MIVNFNIGLLGHVDSGKTSLAKVLSTTASTACFDKNPQSKERGITLDLGFSSLLIEPTDQVKLNRHEIEQMQITLVDCPGHASLIRTIIGGAQIIDMMLLVIDAQKGLQTQTAECIVIGELLQRKLLVVINKIDLLDSTSRDTILKKLDTKLRKTLANTGFGDNMPIFHVSAQNGEGIKNLLEGIKVNTFLPKRDSEKPFLMYVDHCFSIKGQGTICTGTIVQGCVRVNESIEIPAIKEQRKIKSIQMFKKPVQTAAMGDRVGICVTQFSAKMMERGVICQVGYMQTIYAAVIQLHHILYYKFPIKSKTKFHISIGHETVMAHITLFKMQKDHETIFNQQIEYEYVDEINLENSKTTDVFCLIEFETPVFATDNSILIASKLDLDIHTNCCRLAFWGKIKWHTTNLNYAKDQLALWKIYKNKEKRAKIQRLVNDREIIVQNLFKKESNRDIFMGHQIQLSTGETGRIESTFGQTSKVKITFPQSLNELTLKTIKEGRISDIEVVLKFKKYIFNKNVIIKN